MARLSNTASKQERIELHRAKMAGKKFDAQRRIDSDTHMGFTPVSGRLSKVLCAQYLVKFGREPLPYPRSVLKFEKLRSQVAQLVALRQLQDQPTEPLPVAA